MLFNSYAFIFVFLPITLILFHASKSNSNIHLPKVIILLGSLFFYAWWNPYHLYLISSSIIINYYIGGTLSKNKSKIIYALGILFNVGLLAYYKYFNFFIDNINSVLEHPISIDQIVLPLAISFFTFQQVSYLTDCYKSKITNTNFLDYSIFVTFFPQLIAGPIVLYKEMSSQFSRSKLIHFDTKLIIIGFFIFTIGLAKKVLLADNLSGYVDPVFDTASQGGQFSNADAWMAILAYKFQLYFDFSGYADMAIGVGLLFGIHLPINFYSPYKAKNIFDFWNRWHATLARFMRSHVFRPLGKKLNFHYGIQIALIINILLGGIWHGANWNFLLWGIFNAILLVVNHAYKRVKRQHLPNSIDTMLFYGPFCILVTFFFTMLSSVLFRSDNLVAISNMISNLFVSNALPSMLKTGIVDILFIALLFIFVWFLPNTHQIFKSYKVGIEITRGIPSSMLKFSIKRITLLHTGIFSVLFFACIIMLSSEKEFIYFQF